MGHDERPTGVPDAARPAGTAVVTGDAKDNAMTTYVTLAEFTHEAIQNVSDSPRLFEFLEDRAEENGGDLEDAYVTLGEYDVVILSEFPDDESYAQFALTIANQGGLTTDTLRGFDHAEYESVADGVSEIDQPQIWGDS